ncbi:MAG: hypothetical protein QOJ89_3578 [bacterium]|jgi:hypothetical protein
MPASDGETQLTLRINLEAEPITGSLSSARGAQRSFLGWIGLAAALEAIRAELAHEARREEACEPGPGPPDR